MSAFITRTQDSALKRGSRRAALNQWATPAALPLTGRTTLGTNPQLVASDGTDLWVAGGGCVQRVRASDGKLLETWTGATLPTGVLVARGRVYVTGHNTPGNLYVIDPSMAAGPVNTLSSTIGADPNGIATDGSFIWTANEAASVSRVDPDTGSTTNFFVGFQNPFGILFDSANIWVADGGDNTLKKLDSSGNILLSVALGIAVSPRYPVFDGSNIWVPNKSGDSITVVRARDGMVLATLTGNGLNAPVQTAFDGQRILVTNQAGNSVSLWKAADLTSIGTFPTGVTTVPTGACSDGVNFWITLQGFSEQLARF
jgi:streptogramin lyase